MRSEKKEKIKRWVEGEIEFGENFRRAVKKDLKS
jgi:hypothetical protein